MFSCKRFEDFVARMRAHGIPLRLRLWNGDTFDLGEDPRVSVSIRTAGALKHFLPPTLDSLGHAYVEGEIDVEGSLTEVMDLMVRLAAHGVQGRKAQRRLPRTVWHTRRIDPEAIAYHSDVSNDCLPTTERP